MAESAAEPDLPQLGQMLGLLRIHIKRGINLAVRDVRSSDPYVVVRMGKQKLKTSVIEKDVNPKWNEELTLCRGPEASSNIGKTVFDHDTFTPDDPMGDADFSIIPFLEALRMQISGLPDGTIITRVQPSRQNCLAEESCIVFNKGKITQDMALRLRHVERGELEIQLQWIELPGAK